MGQRHQIYVFTTDKNDKGRAYAFHCQWCYGTLPLRHLNRILRFQKKAQDYCGIGEGYDNDINKIQAILSLDIEEGYYGGYCDILEEVTDTKPENGVMGIDTKTIDPDRGDNNDGITIIHVNIATREVKYCFMNIGEEDKDYGDIHSAKSKTPLSAKEYVSCYYKQGDKRWKGLDVSKILKTIGKTPVLTLEECKRLLPKFYAKKLVKA